MINRSFSPLPLTDKILIYCYVGLVMVTTLWWRLHNYIATALSTMHYDWNDDQLFMVSKYYIGKVSWFSQKQNGYVSYYSFPRIS